MSVFLLIGQCGIQLGLKLLDDIFQELKSKNDPNKSSKCSFFHFSSSIDPRPTANAILIDMESKVVESSLLLTQGLQFSCDRKYSFTRQEGSGNNWAYGFNVHGPFCKKDILIMFEKISREIDGLANVILVQSIAGGTGSGLGSFILSILSEEFPSLFFINFLVIPKLAGEVILQFFNSIFSLSSISENSDAIFILENDKANVLCKSLFKMSSVNLDDMNFVLSKFVVSSLLLGNGTNESFFDILENHLLLLPHLKLLGSRFVPLTGEELKSFSNDTWKSLMTRAQQMMITGSTEANINWHVKPLGKEPDRPSHKLTSTLFDKKIVTQLISTKINRSLGIYVEFNNAKGDFDDEVINEAFQDKSFYFSGLSSCNYISNQSFIKRKVL